MGLLLLQMLADAESIKSSLMLAVTVADDG